MRSESREGLKRSLGLFALVVYGIGDILGAGIYALIGKVAGLAGNGCWLAFVFSFVVASLTGFSYAELGSRYPRSARQDL
jgi:amino acid transporter